MRRIAMLTLCLGLAMVASGCSWRQGLGGFYTLSPINRAFAVTPVQPPPGFIYQNTQAPLTTNFADAKAAKRKVGVASTSYVGLWPITQILSFGFDNASIETAALNGGLKKVSFADYEQFNVFGVYSRFTVTAYGE